MALDGITLKLIKNELSASLLGSKIISVHQPSKDELILSLRTREGNVKLLISASSSAPRIHLIDKEIDNPKVPPMFCMLLRKHLSGAKLVDIEQLGVDRILFLSFSTYNELGDPIIIKLAVEIMGRHSNIILINDKNKIVDSIKRVTADMSSVRQVMPGMTYELPPSQNKIDILDADYMLLNEKLLNGKDLPLSKGLLGLLDGISPIVAREIAEYVCGDSDKLSSELTNDECEKLVNIIDIIAKNVNSGSCSPYIVFDENKKPVDFTFMPVRQYGDKCTVKRISSFSSMLDSFYSEKTGTDRMKQRSGDLYKFIINLADRISRKLDIQKSELKKSVDRENLRIKGELINANLNSIEKGMTSVLLENFYDNGNLIDVKLDPRLTPAQNAQHYFMEYRKADTAERMLRELIFKGENELSYIESVFDFLSRARTEDEILSIKNELVEQGYIKLKNSKVLKSIKLAPKEYRTTDGFRILCGRNNLQNDKLTFKDSKKDDIWFHTQKIHGSHTILITEGKEPSPDAIQQAAIVAAYNSKGRDSSLVPVDYTEVRNVHKPSGSSPGKVIYEHYKTAFVRPSLFQNYFE